MVREIEIQEYLKICNSVPLIDVRSPGEFKKGKIPGAVNIPLFSDAERASVGAMYTKQSSEKAIELAYRYVNPKLDSFIHDSSRIAPKNQAVVHCWRGGMRSRAFAKHLEENGFTKVLIIKQGYKAFRNLALNAYSPNTKLLVLGGYTGSGKTRILKILKKKGHQVIDIEGIANHKGSAFGSIGNNGQPTTEQFENNLFWEWKDLDHTKPVWIEDESHRLGNVNIPEHFYRLILEKPVFFLDIPKYERAKYLVQDYAEYNKTELGNSISRISKRLGGLNAQKALQNLEKGKYLEVALLVLTYYDKLYLKGLSARDQKLVFRMKLETTDHEKNAERIEQYCKTHSNE